MVLRAQHVPKQAQRALYRATLRPALNHPEQGHSKLRPSFLEESIRTGTNFWYTRHFVCMANLGGRPSKTGADLEMRLLFFQNDAKAIWTELPRHHVMPRHGITVMPCFFKLLRHLIFGIVWFL